MTDAPDLRRHPREGTSGSGVRAQRAEPGAEHGRDAPEPTGPDHRPPGRIVRTATEGAAGRNHPRQVGPLDMDLLLRPAGALDPGARLVEVTLARRS